MPYDQPVLDTEGNYGVTHESLNREETSGDPSGRYTTLQSFGPRGRIRPQRGDEKRYRRLEHETFDHGPVRVESPGNSISTPFLTQETGRWLSWSWVLEGDRGIDLKPFRRERCRSRDTGTGSISEGAERGRRGASPSGEDDYRHPTPSLVRRETVTTGHCRGKRPHDGRDCP